MHKYSTTLKTMGFLYLETKKAAALFLQDESGDMIIRQSLEDNIFMMKTEIRKREIASTILNRLNALDEYLLKKIVHGNLGLSKLIVLMAIIKTDRLFYEFTHEVFAEKLIVMDKKITARDITNFFHRKSEQSEQVARWADYTHYKLGQVYRKLLLEANMAKPEKDGLHIIKPVFEKEVTEHIKAIGDQQYLNVMIGGR
jgi:hypothetical protein